MKYFFNRKTWLLLFVIILIYMSLVTIMGKEPDIIMYSLDGRELIVAQDEVEAYQNVGWYIEPVTLMYSIDGRTLVVKKTEIDMYKNVGWYEEPVVYMYAIDGRTLIVLQSEITIYENVGWYTEPVIYMYSAKGEVLIVKESEIELYKNVNWFLSKEEAMYNNINKRELELLARIIHAEAADNNYLDRCYTGMVVMNRKNSGIWGDTIYKVITAPGQYSSYSNKKFNSEIPSECYEIAKKIMMGETFGVPSNVIYQSGAPQGKGVWQVIKNTSGYYNHYYCYGNI